MQTIYIKKIQKIQTKSKKYDIETENHCFFANGILVHNCSATYYIKEGNFGLCSRNLEVKPEGENPIVAVAKKYGIEQHMREIMRDIAIQGEIIGCHPNGKGICGNPYRLPAGTYEFYLFNAYDLEFGCYLGYYDLFSLSIALQLKTVPILNADYHLPENVEDIQHFAHAKSKINPAVLREGIVVRSIGEGQDPDLHLRRLSFKCVDNEYRIKEKSE